MTVQEALEILHGETREDALYQYDREDRPYILARAEGMAIKALKEVEQYRALGTVEGFQNALDGCNEYYNQMKEYKAKLQEYEALGTPTQICERIGGLDVELGKYHCLGTVEELKEAREKQVAKEVIFSDDGDSLLCPNCGFDLMGCINEPDHDPYYCPECGKALKWGEEDEP